MNLKVSYKCIFLSIFFVIGINSYAQKPLGKFIDKKVKIGVPIRFALSYKHDPSHDVFFPDSSNTNFSPFVFKGLKFFPTVTQNGMSIDSVLYELVSFEIDSVQYLRLPVSILSKKDSTIVFSTQDSIVLDALVKKSDLINSRLKESTEYLKINQEFDYPKFLKYLLLLVSLLSMFLVFFRKLIIRNYKLFWFDIKHKNFVKSFKKMMKFQKSNDIVATRDALVLWKNHLEWLENIPFSSFSTKEILEKIDNKRLEEALKEIDTAVYGGQTDGNLSFALQILNSVSVEKYKKCRKDYINKLK